MNPEDIPLRDLHLPEPIGWWPLAPGWWLVLALVAGLLVWLALRALRYWRRGHARRVALAEVRKLAARHAQDGDAQQLAKQLSSLLRRAMLAYAPRHEVARLTGEAWMRWLDRGLPEPLFSAGPGRSLAWLPYRAPDQSNDPVDVDGLVRAVRQRLATPLPGETG